METNILASLLIAIISVVIVSMTTMFFVFRQRYRTLANQVDEQNALLDSELDVSKLHSNYSQYILKRYCASGFRGFVRVTADGVKEENLPPSLQDGGYVSSTAQDVEKNNLVLASEEILHHTKVVLLGNPGSGKTTTLLRIMCKLAQSEKELLPIYVPLSAYASVLMATDTPLLSYLSKYHEDSGASTTPTLFESAISQGQSVILLDGLDEVISGHVRSEIISRIGNLANVIPQGNKIVVTSRIAEHNKFLFDSSWTTLNLVGWNEDIVNTFIRNWYQHVFSAGSVSKSESERRSEDLISSINSNPLLKAMSTNPLMLSNLVMLHYNGGRLPSFRVDLYSRFLEILIERGKIYKSSASFSSESEFDYLVTLEVLTSLALWVREKNETALRKDELVEWLINYFMSEEWKKPRGEAVKSAGKFLDEIRVSSGVLVEFGLDKYMFAHRLLLDILAAIGIAKMQGEKRTDFIHSHISDQTWQESIVLAIGVLGIQQRRLLESRETIKQILKMGKSGTDIISKCVEEYGDSDIFTEELFQTIKKSQIAD